MARPRKDKSETPAPAAPVTEVETTTDQTADAGTTTAATEPAASEPTTSTPAATIEPKPSKAKEPKPAAPVPTAKAKADPVPRTIRAFNKGDALALWKAREEKPYAHGAIEAVGRDALGTIADIRPDGHGGAELPAVPVFDSLTPEQREQVADSGLQQWAECLPKS